jgi:purine-nucleoside phosphorylase
MAAGMVDEVLSHALTLKEAKAGGDNAASFLSSLIDRFETLQ